MFDLKAYVKHPLFVNMANHLTELLYIVDEEGRILFINKAAEDFEQICLKDVFGKFINDIYKQDESPTLKALTTGRPIREHENTYIMNGKEFLQLAASYPIIYNDRVIGAYTIQRDMTTIKQIFSDNVSLKKKENKWDFDSLIGETPEFLHCVDIARSAAANDASVLLAGYTGSGKEIFANAIHNNSARRDHPFLAINCAAIPESLLESLLFGTTKGSFTGSIDKAGLFEQAKGGTLFLDEINSMSLNSQAKLLRVLEEKELRRLGGSSNIKTDVRIISSMNTTPSKAIKKGQLRQDLFYRLSVISIVIPPLVSRKRDIELLTEHFIQTFNKKYEKNIRGLDYETRQFFMTFSWPGNVRQLKHVIESAVNITPDNDALIHLKALPQYLSDALSGAETSRRTVEQPQPAINTFYPASAQPRPIHESPQFSVPNQEMPMIDTENLFSTIENREKAAITQALLDNNGNIAKAARQLNMNRQNLVYRMKKYHIQKKKN